MLPVLQAIGMVFSAISAVNTVKNMMSDTSKTAAATTGAGAGAKQAAASPTGSTGAAGTAGTAGGTGAGEIQDRFLKLLVTQLKNQDPLNPMDNAQLTTQLAQINTVSGIQQLNTTMAGLSTSLLSAQSTQSASLIGRTVLAESSTLKLDAGKTAIGGAQLAQAAERVRINILGPAGNLVRQFELGAQKEGLSGFEWDGKNDAGVRVDPGNYTFHVTATNGTQNVGATPVAAGLVSSITLGSGGSRLNVDGVGEIAMQQIRNIM
jgi:flagellar basal-body rod modification protein FlgD